MDASATFPTMERQVRSVGLMTTSSMRNFCLSERTAHRSLTDQNKFLTSSRERVGRGSASRLRHAGHLAGFLAVAPDHSSADHSFWLRDAPSIGWRGNCIVLLVGTSSEPLGRTQPDLDSVYAWVSPDHFVWPVRRALHLRLSGSITSLRDCRYLAIETIW